MKKNILSVLSLLLLIFGLYLFKNKPEILPTSDLDPLESLPAFLSWPLDKANERSKLLTFGMYVTPDPSQNPISPPERFIGYHTGLDIEVLPEERDLSVVVTTACDGKILYIGLVEGYGGVVIQECAINNEKVSILYGHLNPTSIKVPVSNENVSKKTAIAELGRAYTSETGGTRKHLHLGVHKGNHIEFLGYVSDPKDLQDFIDPLFYLENGA